MRASAPVFLFILLLSAGTVRSQLAENELDQVYSSASTLLEEGSYKQALLDYTRLINSGFENDAVWVKRGLAHYYLKEYQLAKEDFDEAYKRQVRTPELLGFRAMTKLRLGELDNLTEFDQAFSAGFKNSEAAFLAGNHLFQAGNFQAAVSYYDKSASWESADPVMYNNRGKAYLNLGKPEMAMKDFDKALVLDATFLKAKLNRANAFSYLQQWEKARKDFEEAGKEVALEGDDYGRMGITYYHLKEYSLAVENLDAAFKRQSKLDGMYRFLGLAYAETGDHRKAIQMLEVSLTEAGSDSEIMVRLAELYYQERQYASALKYAKDAQANGNRSTSVLEGLSLYHLDKHEEAYNVLGAVYSPAVSEEAHPVMAQLYSEHDEFLKALDALKNIPDRTSDVNLLKLEAMAYSKLGRQKDARPVLDAWKKLAPDNIELLKESARNHMELNQYQEAGNDLIHAIAISSKDMELNCLYGEVLLMKKDYSKAIEYLEIALKNGADTPVHAMLGMAYYRSGNFEKSFEHLQTASTNNMLSGEGVHDLTISAFETGRYKETLEFAEKALTMKVDEAKLQVVRGLSLYHTGAIETARPILEKAAVNHPADTRISMALGTIVFNEANYTKAVEWLNKAVSGGENTSALILRGRANLALSNYDLAIADFTSVLSANKDDDKARYYRGEALFKSGKFDKAPEDLLLVNTKSLDLPVNEMIALSYSHTKDKKALEYLEKSIGLGSTLPEIYLHAGMKQAGERQWEKAVARLNMAEEKGTKSPDLNNTRGAAYFYLGRYREALGDLMISGIDKSLIGLSHYHLEEYDQSIGALSQVTSPDKTVMVALGDAYYRKENWENAEKIFDRLVADGEADATIYRHRGMVYAGSGRNDAAAGDLKKSLELEPASAATIQELVKVYAQLKQYGQLTALYEQAQGIDGISNQTITLAAKAYYHQEMMDKASPLLEAALKSGTADKEAAAYLGHIRYLEKQYEDAIKYLSQALSESADNKDWVTWKGLSLFAVKKYEEAYRDLSRAISLGENSAETQFAAGFSAYETGKVAEAIDHLTAASEAGYDKPELYYIRGNALYRTDKFAQAVSDYDRAISGGLSDPVLFNNKGKAQYTLGMPEEAVKTYTKALELDASYLRALENRGETLYELARFEEAATDLKQVISLKEESDGRIRYLLGQTYFQLKDYRKAVVYYGEAISQGNQTAEVYFRRGKSYALLDELSSALSDLNQAFNGGKKDAEFFLERANVNIRMENTRAAMTDLNEAINQDKENSDAYFNRGYLHELNENYNEAISDYSKAVELNPSDHVAFYSLANSLVSQGNVGGAMKPIDKAIELMPENGTYHKVRGNIMYRLERTQDACSSWEKAVELGDLKAGYYIKEYCD